ncbi:uncharacterized protein [Diabrotica undecimpunctata]|uniref:uncharacterized protein n=1 Tax=Diabrotica undecimpunctata TaxID=50387 RepID=UPI003B63CCF3
MPHNYCCVSNCKNKKKNSCYSFHRFPKRSYLVEQRHKWIVAVQKINGFSWMPKKNDVICSHHFLGQKMSNESASPSYVPTIFDSSQFKSKESSKVKATQAINRYSRYKRRLLASSFNKTAMKRTQQVVTESDFINSQQVLTCGKEEGVYLNEYVKIEGDIKIENNIKNEITEQLYFNMEDVKVEVKSEVEEYNLEDFSRSNQE